MTAPAVARNRGAILSVLREHLPASGLVLEVAAGSGEHAAYFAAALPGLRWQPTDPEPRARASIAAHAKIADLANLLAPLDLDAASPVWPVAQADVVVAINMVHISPWSATLGLLAGAARVLPEGGLLYLYGPYMEDGRHTAPSNAAFDTDLRARDPAWGIRDVQDVEQAASPHGLRLAQRIAMPANNLSVLFRKAPPGAREGYHRG
ncbi:DUF938 domain-containing protein [Methylobacterium terrae]|nr:DUF938 domain-containing protein [Methylobacterium terrae]